MSHPDYQFAGRRAIVTGAAAGIGRRIGERLVAAGADVIGWDLNTDGADGVAMQHVDITRPSDIEAAVAALPWGDAGVDVLVHAAGWLGPSAPVLDYDPAIWRRIIDINLTGTFDVARAVAPLMTARPDGRIVILASLAGKEGTPNAAAYSASKAGVIAFTKAFGKELAATNVRVNCIAPAAIETGMLDQVAPEHVATMVAKSPMGRLGTVDEVAELALWLASPACSFSTGGVFDLSGGRATY